jgi:TRAP-type transport system small permease protein
MSDGKSQGTSLGNVYAVLEKIVSAISGILLTGMVLIVFSNVIGRYFLNSALAWSEEISRFMMIWLVWFGSVLAFINNEHLGLDLVIKVLPRKVSLAVLVVADVLVMYALYLIAIGGWQVTAQTMESGWTSPAAAVPYGFVYLVVPICGIVLLVQAAFKLAANVRNFVTEMKGGAL